MVNLQREPIVEVLPDNSNIFLWLNSTVFIIIIGTSSFSVDFIFVPCFVSVFLILLFCYYSKGYIIYFFIHNRVNFCLYPQVFNYMIFIKLIWINFFALCCSETGTFWKVMTQTENEFIDGIKVWYIKTYTKKWPENFEKVEKNEFELEVVSPLSVSMSPCQDLE